MREPYVIVTPAYNEANYIEHTITSVIQQTVRPAQWIIVDDGSTDKTSVMINSYARTCSFIRYLRRRRNPEEAYFASNVGAITEGVRQVTSLPYTYLAILDADIILPKDYYERILRQFQADPTLGVASGVYENLVDGRLQTVLHDCRSTPKALQVFRRTCFEQIGGYVPLAHGGEDTCACAMARMHGWRTWSFPQLKAVHQRPTGLRNAGNLLRVRFAQGICEYGLSTHPLFMVVKSLRRCFLEHPLLIGGMLRLGGYTYAYLKREPRQIPSEVASYVRHEQVDRVLGFNRVVKKVRSHTGSL